MSIPRLLVQASLIAVTLASMGSVFARADLASEIEKLNLQKADIEKDIETLSVMRESLAKDLLLFHSDPEALLEKIGPPSSGSNCHSRCVEQCTPADFIRIYGLEVMESQFDFKKHVNSDSSACMDLYLGSEGRLHRVSAQCAQAVRGCSDVRLEAHRRQLTRKTRELDAVIATLQKESGDLTRNIEKIGPQHSDRTVKRPYEPSGDGDSSGASANPSEPGVSDTGAAR